MRTNLVALSSAAAVLALFSVLSALGVFNRDVWVRDKPLVGAIAVAQVQNGDITLADGRTFRLAGVSRLGNVSASDYDLALRAIVAQGVVVTHDFGDGRAFLIAEPKFYNWCGTRGYKGNPYAHWAGSYFQCPVSELLIHSAYSKAEPDQPGLTSRERWRIEGAEHFGPVDEPCKRVANNLVAMRYCSVDSYFQNYESSLEAFWKPPPP